MTIDSYIIISLKKVIDLKYVSITKILIIYGIFGTLFTLLFSLIATFISCGKKNDEIYDIYDYLCKVVDKNGDRYFDNFNVYFQENLWKDLLITIFCYVGLCFYRLFLLKIIQYLSPIHKSFCFPLIFFFQKILLIYQINDHEPKKYINESFFIDLSSDFAAIIGFLIYLEIIELNFFDLNKDLRKNIITRGKTEINEIEMGNKDDDSSINEE